VLGYGAARTGLAMLPAAVMIGTMSLGFSSRLNARFGERTVLLAGLVPLVAALGLLTRLPAHSAYVVHVLPTMLLAGGFGLAISALTALGMSDAGRHDAGVASGLFNTTQQVGGALGVAVLSTLAAGRTRALLAGGHDGNAGAHGIRAAATGGFQLAFGIGAGLVAAAFVLAVIVLRQPGGPARTATMAEDESTEPRSPATV
jgi:MFS family permease